MALPTPRTSHQEKRHIKKVVKSRRPSFDIARDYVEMNFAVLMEPELTPKELKKKRRAEAKAEKKAEKQRHRIRNTFLSLLGLLIIAAGIGLFWWNTALEPVKPVKDDSEIATQRFTIEAGATTDQIAANLQKWGFIRSELAFRIYCRLNHIVIQAGDHELSPSYSTPKIAELLTSAQAEEIEIMVPPGKTLDELRAILLNIKDKNENTVYTNVDIDAAYAADYNNPVLFEGRPKDLPAKTRLEVYIYPDTYRIYSTDKLEALIKKSLKKFEQVAAQNDLKAKFAAQKLSFYQGVTLASIVVKEVTNADDQKTVARVFYNRLAQGISLGADATHNYAIARGFCTGKGDINTCTSPYNTRNINNKGLTPGPIANISLSALVAVANPDSSPEAKQYLYFVSGGGIDQGKTFFSRTDAEHQANIAAHCRELCQ